MNAIIQQFHLELTREERALFEKDARKAGRRPGEHLKVVLFKPGAAGVRAASPGVSGPRRSACEAAPPRSHGQDVS